MSVAPIPPVVVEVPDPRLEGIEQMVPGHVPLGRTWRTWPLNGRSFTSFSVALRCFCLAMLPPVLVLALAGQVLAAICLALLLVWWFGSSLNLKRMYAAEAVSRGELALVERYAGSRFMERSARDAFAWSLAFARGHFDEAATLAAGLAERAPASTKRTWQALHACALAYAGKAPEARALLPVATTVEERGIALYVRLAQELTIAFCANDPRIELARLSLAAAAGRRSGTAGGLLVLAAWAYEARGNSAEARSLLIEDGHKPEPLPQPPALAAWYEAALTRLGVPAPVRPAVAPSPRRSRVPYIVAGIIGLLLGTVMLLAMSGT